jgi:hypothetical protein
MSGLFRRDHYDPIENKFTVERIQDVEPILERNKALKAEVQKADSFHHIGEIPNVIVERWLNEEYERGNVGLHLGHPDFLALCKRKLQDPDWAFLRVTDKRF